MKKHRWDYYSQIRECAVCRMRETYWDDEAYPYDPCPGKDARDWTDEQWQEFYEELEIAI